MDNALAASEMCVHNSGTVLIKESLKALLVAHVLMLLGEEKCPVFSLSYYKLKLRTVSQWFGFRGECSCKILLLVVNLDVSQKRSNNANKWEAENYIMLMITV